MGIPVATMDLLINLKKREGLSGSVLTFGRQWIIANPEIMNIILRKHGFSVNINYRNQGSVTDDEFFHGIGFTSIKSLDVSDFDGATITADLNYPINELLSETFDVVFDGGTMEHCFNPPAVLANAANLTKHNGVVIHELPVNNCVDHGFYQFSPTFLYEYYLANGWDIIDSTILLSNKKDSFATVEVFNYFPGCINDDSVKLWGTKSVSIWLAARKKEGAKVGVYPLQGSYKKQAAWASGLTGN